MIPELASGTHGDILAFFQQRLPSNEFRHYVEALAVKAEGLFPVGSSRQSTYPRSLPLALVIVRKSVPSTFWSPVQIAMDNTCWTGYTKKS